MKPQPLNKFLTPCPVCDSPKPPNFICSSCGFHHDPKYAAQAEQWRNIRRKAIKALIFLLILLITGIITVICSTKIIYSIINHYPL